MPHYLKDNSIFNFEEFENIVENDDSTYINNKPFSHGIYKNLFNNDSLRKIVEEFPDETNDIWDKREDLGIQVKLRTKWESENDITDNTLKVVQILHSGRFCRLLSKLTGIKGLMSDCWFGGGGLNKINRGGELAIHVDGTHNDDINMYRRVNVILFLNEHWKEEYGGALELWDAGKNKCEVAIPPFFNNLVIFNTNDFTYHGHPYPLNCPEGESRKSLILYYYTSDKPDTEKNFDDKHRAMFSSREELGIS